MISALQKPAHVGGLSRLRGLRNASEFERVIRERCVIGTIQAGQGIPRCETASERRLTASFVQERELDDHGKSKDVSASLLLRMCTM